MLSVWTKMFPFCSPFIGIGNRNVGDLLAYVCGRNCEQRLQMMPPHSLQWWRRLVMLKDLPQVVQRLTSESGAQWTMAFSNAE